MSIERIPLYPTLQALVDSGVLVFSSSDVDMDTYEVPGLDGHERIGNAFQYVTYELEVWRENDQCVLMSRSREDGDSEIFAEDDHESAACAIEELIEGKLRGEAP